MDRRLAERRRRVAEDRARSNLGRLVRLLLVVAVLGGLVWFAQSPFLSVDEIVVEGADRVDVAAALARSDVVPGRPMLLVDVAGAEERLAADPWVAAAEVGRDWPTRIVAVVEERVPFAALRLAEGWWVVSDDATLLEPIEGPGDLPVAEFPDSVRSAVDEDLDVEGAVAYLAALPVDVQADARVFATAEGLEATVAGFTVRLGRPFDMEEKAAVTAAILEQEVEEGAIITVVAPASPAVLPPGADAGEAPDTTTP
jgi:cell division protein FtsQ